jgi:hypothetical protein
MTCIQSFSFAESIKQTPTKFECLMLPTALGH